MIEVVYIEQRIKNLLSHKRRYNFFIVLSITMGVLSICIAFFLGDDNSAIVSELPKFGFGIIASLLAVLLQNEKLKVENKLASLNLVLQKVMSDPSIGADIVKQAITEI